MRKSKKITVAISCLFIVALVGIVSYAAKSVLPIKEAQIPEKYKQKISLMNDVDTLVNELNNTGNIKDMSKNEKSSYSVALKKKIASIEDDKEKYKESVKSTMAVKNTEQLFSEKLSKSKKVIIDDLPMTENNPNAKNVRTMLLKRQKELDRIEREYTSKKITALEGLAQLEEVKKIQ